VSARTRRGSRQSLPHMRRGADGTSFAFCFFAWRQVALEPSVFTQEKFELYKLYQRLVHNDDDKGQESFEVRGLLPWLSLLLALALA